MADQIHYSKRPVAQLAVVWIIFSRQSWIEATECITEAISYATLSFSKRLLNDVVFI